jgi:hypothetical protein
MDWNTLKKRSEAELNGDYSHILGGGCEGKK